MRLKSLLVAALAGFGVVACSETAPPPSQVASNAAPLVKTEPPAARTGGLASVPEERPPSVAPRPAAPAAPALAANSSAGSLRSVRNESATPAAPSAPIPPADAQWTISCYIVDSPMHVEDAKNLKSALTTKTGRKDWYVIHGAEKSTLYFGFYRSINDKDDPDTERGRKDRDFVSKVEDARKNKPFHGAAFVQLSAPDPSSRPEWNLSNVDRNKAPDDPTRAYWSLQIMAFNNNQLRKDAAIQAVADLRAQGVEAYYYHGESVSSVCVGAWPPSAVRSQQVSNDLQLGKKDVAHSKNPMDTVIVSSEPLTADMLPKPKDNQGNRVVAVAPKLEVQDEKMKATLARFKEHAVNYEVHVKKGLQGTEFPDQSFLVTIPRPKGNGLFDSGVAAPTRTVDTVDPRLTNPIAPPVSRRDAAMNTQARPAGAPPRASDGNR